MQFEGSAVALVTPFKNGKVDEAALRRLIERQIENGTDVISPCGTTGESATLSHEEHIRVIEITVDQTKKKARVLAGAGSNATHEAIRLHQGAYKAGADGALHITPYYNRPPQEGLFQHFRAIAESNPLPVVLYNVPARTGVNLLPETVARLSEVKPIVGIKEAAGSLEQVSKIISLCRKDFVVLSGEDALTLEILKRGGKGSVSVTANVAPKECALQWKAFQAGKMPEAEKLHQKLLPLHDAMFYETNPIPVKAALALMGLIEEEYRLPLVKMSQGNRSRLKEVMTKYGLKL